jgi:hypothetical protein
MCVCTCECAHVLCVSSCVDKCTCACARVYLRVCVNGVCICVCVWIDMYVCLHASVPMFYVCVYLCVYGVFFPCLTYKRLSDAALMLRHTRNLEGFNSWWKLRVKDSLW